MNKEIVLQVNIESQHSASKRYAFLDAIITNDSLYSENIAIIKINEDISNWMQNASDCIIEKNKKCLKISDNMFCENKEIFLYREALNNEDIVIYVENYRHVGNDGVINMVLSTNQEGNMLGDSDAVFRIGYIIGKEYYAKLGKAYIILDSPVSYEIKWLRLKRENLKINVFTSNNGKNWDKILQTKLPNRFLYEKNVIGININLGENPIKLWNLNNYIQLFGKADENGMYEIDYYILPEKNYTQCTLHPFLDFKLTEVKKYGYHYIYKKIYRSLCKDEYIEIDLKNGKNFIDSNNEELDSHFLIYGIKRKMVMMLGYVYGEGIVKKQITMKKLVKIVRNEKVLKFRLIKTTILYNQYHFESKIIRNMLSEYINGVNSSYWFANLVPIKNAKYGIEIYNEICNDETLLKQIAEDPQLTFVLHEQVKLMEERILYMKEKRILNMETNEIKQIEKEIYCLKEKLLILYTNAKQYKENAKECIGINEIRDILYEIRNNQVKVYGKIMKGINDGERY